MSSTYKALCLSHDPAIVLDSPEWHSGDGGVERSVAAVSAGLDGHPGCDLLVGRYSYPLVEVCCPAAIDAGAQREGTQCFHREPKWVDASWLRLAALALDAPAGSPLRKAVERVGRCWTPDRLRRLRVELGVAEAARQ